MDHSNRRAFLQTATILLGAMLTGSSFKIKNPPLLSFSTLGCPDWPFDKIMGFASEQGYSGLEIRGIQRQLDLTKCKEFNTAENRAATLRMMKARNLKFVGLGSSATLHFSAGAERDKNLDEGRRFIDLAHEIECPYIRVFPNNFPKDQERKTTMELMSKGLLELGKHAKGSRVTVLMETHGDLVKADDIEKVIQAADHSNTGLVWDITNMWTITKEPPAQVYEKLKKYIRHTHIKDAKITDGKISYTLLGRGDVPIFEAIRLLEKGGYNGYYSFEWEKLWHPEIAAPEIALADYPKAIQQQLKLIEL